MNKTLHALVYVFLALAAAGLWFELQLNATRTALTDRNEIQEDRLRRLARTIEKAEPDKGFTVEEIRMDVSPVEARIVDAPDMENVLDGYNGYLEVANLETYNWDGQAERDQLRAVYQLDMEGKPVMDRGRPVMEGPGTEADMLDKLIESAKGQQSRLNSTRAELAALRSRFANIVAEVNRLKPAARQDKVTLVEKEEKIAALEDDKLRLEGQVTKVKAQVDELNVEITSLRDEVATAKDETEAAKEELAKAQKLVEQLKKILKDSIPTQGARANESSIAVTSLPAGDKGAVISVDNENMFAIAKFSDEAMKELKGENLDHPLPAIELSVRRPGFNGDAGEFVGRLRLRQEVKGKPYVICDVLGAWEQAKLQPNDVIFAD